MPILKTTEIEVEYSRSNAILIALVAALSFGLGVGSTLLGQSMRERGATPVVVGGREMLPSQEVLMILPVMDAARCQAVLETDIDRRCAEFVDEIFSAEVRR